MIMPRHAKRRSPAPYLTIYYRCRVRVHRCHADLLASWIDHNDLLPVGAEHAGCSWWPLDQHTRVLGVEWIVVSNLLNMIAKSGDKLPEGKLHTVARRQTPDMDERHRDRERQQGLSVLWSHH